MVIIIIVIIIIVVIMIIVITIIVIMIIIIMPGSSESSRSGAADIRISHQTGPKVTEHYISSSEYQCLLSTYLGFDTTFD